MEAGIGRFIQWRLIGKIKNAGRIDVDVQRSLLCFVSQDCVRHDASTPVRGADESNRNHNGKSRRFLSLAAVIQAMRKDCAEVLTV